MTQPLPCSCPCLSLPYSSPKLQLYACHDSTIALLMSMSLSHTVHPSYSCTRATTQPLPCSCPCLSLSYSSPKLQLYACHDSTIALLMSMSLSPIQFTQVTAVRVPRLNHCPAHVHVSLSYSSPKLQLYACHDSTIALLMSMSLSHTVHPVTAVRVPRLIALLMSMSLSHTVHPSYSCTHAMTQPLPCSCPCLSLSYSSPKLQLYACHDSTIALLMSMSLSHTVHQSYSCTRAMTQPLPCPCPCLSLIQFTQVTAVRVPRLNHCPAHVSLSLSYSSPKLQLYACHDSTIALLMSMSLSLTVHPSYSCTCSCPCPLSLTVHPSYSCTRAMTQPLPCSCPCLSLSHTVHPSYSCTRAMTQPLPCSCPCLSLLQFTQITAVRVP